MGQWVQFNRSLALPGVNEQAEGLPRVRHGYNTI